VGFRIGSGHEVGGSIREEREARQDGRARAFSQKGAEETDDDDGESELTLAETVRGEDPGPILESTYPRSTNQLRWTRKQGQGRGSRYERRRLFRL
jgi:hypothetical protein